MHFLAHTTLKTVRRQIQACTFLLTPLSRLCVAKSKHALSCSHHSQDCASPNPSMHFLARTTLKTVRRQIQACTFLLTPLSRLCVAKSKHALSCSHHSQDCASSNPSMHFLAHTTLKTVRRQIQACTFLLAPLSRLCVAKSKHALSCSHHSQDCASPNPSMHFLAHTTLKTVRRQIQACTFLLTPLSRLCVAKSKHALSCSHHSQDYSSPNPSMHFLA